MSETVLVVNTQTSFQVPRHVCNKIEESSVKSIISRSYMQRKAVAYF